MSSPSEKKLNYRRLFLLVALAACGGPLAGDERSSGDGEGEAEIRPGATSIQGEERDPEEFLGELEQANPSALTSAPSVAPIPQVDDLARSLSYDVDMIYQHIHDNIRHEPGWGLKKGPVGVLVDQVGNAFDLANLMVGLLRASGYTAHFQTSTIRLDAGAALAWFGTTNGAAIKRMLVNAAIPSGPASVLSDGSLASVNITHVWVVASGKELGSQQYVFDPAFKNMVVYAPRVDLKAAMGFDRTALVAAAAGQEGALPGISFKDFDGTALKRQLHLFATNLIRFMRQPENRNFSVDEVLGARRINRIAGSADERATANPRHVPGSIIVEQTAIPDINRAAVSVKIGGIDRKLFADELSGKRLTLRFDGGDGKAVLRLDGTTLATATSKPSNGKQTLTLNIDEPYDFGDQTSSVDLKTGANYTYAIIVGFGETGFESAELHRKKLLEFQAAKKLKTSEEMLGESLARLGDLWLAQRIRTAKIMYRVRQSHATLHHCAGVAGYNSAPFLDLPMCAWSPSRLADGSDDPATFISDSGFGSAFESAVIEQAHTVNGISTVSMFETANEKNLTFFETNLANWSTVQTKITGFDANEKARIKSYLDKGDRVIIPSNGTLTVGTYKGTSFLTVGANNAHVGHIINGAKGGFCSAPIPIDNVVNDYTSMLQCDCDRFGGLFQNHTFSGDPVDVVTGAFTHQADDLATGATASEIAKNQMGSAEDSADAGLVFIRSYNSAASLVNDCNMGYGWGNNLAKSIVEDSDPFQGLGRDSVVDAAPMLVGLIAASELLSESFSLKNLLLATLTQYWAAKNLVENSATFQSWGSNQQFIKLPSGVSTPDNKLLFEYNPPPGSVDKLVKSTAATPIYTLTQKDGKVLTFDSRHLLKTSMNPNGVGLTYTWNTGSTPYVVTKVAHTFGWSLTLGYDGSRRLASVTGDGSRIARYGYDTTFNLSWSDDPGAKRTTYKYASRGKLESIFLPTAKDTPQMVNLYDNTGRVKEQKNSLGKTTEYFVTGWFSKEVDPLGNTKRWWFEEFGQPWAYKDQRGRVQYTRYSVHQLPISITFPEGNQTLYSYDERFNVSETRKIPKPGSSLPAIVERATYDPTWNKPISYVDALNQETRLEYDVKGNLKKIVRPIVDGVQPETRFEYNTRGQVTLVTDPTLRKTKFTYDETGRKQLLTMEVDPDNLKIVTKFHYDASGNIDQITDPRNNVTKYVYNKNGNLTDIQWPVPETNVPPPAVQYEYDDSSRRVATKNKIGGGWQIERRTYTTSGKLESVSNPDYVVTEQTPKTVYGYDDAERLVSTTDPEGRVTRLEYHPDGTLYREIRAYGTPEQIVFATYAYSPNGNVVSIDDAKGNRTSYSYDGHDRLSRTTFASLSTPGTTDATDYIENSYDDGGNLTAMRTRSGAVFTYTYDVLGRQRERRGGGLPVLTSHYDAADRTTHVSEETRTISFGYDTAGRRTTTTSQRGTWALTATFGHDPAGNIREIKWPDGWTVTYSYDAMNRLRSVTTPVAGVGATIFYDQLNRRTSLVRGPISTRYRYYPSGRLYDLVHDLPNATDDMTLSFVYDRSGKLVSQYASSSSFVFDPGPNTDQDDESAIADGKNRITAYAGVVQTHDANGNHTSLGATLTFDNLNRLTRVDGTDTQTQTYEYNPLGERVRASSIETLIAEGFELADYASDNAIIRRFVPSHDADEPLAVVLPDNVIYFPVTDHRRSVLAKVDATGFVAERFSYGPFGEPSLAGCDPSDRACMAARWLGRRLDPVSGLYDLRNRVYSSEIGRFAQTDPIGQKDDVNVYAYAGNDPCNMIDPTGTDACTCPSSFDSWSMDWSFNAPEYDLEPSSYFYEIGLGAGAAIGLGAGGRSKNDLGFARHPNGMPVTEPHSTFKMNPSGRVTDYMTFETNPKNDHGVQRTLAFHDSGRHGSVEGAHVHDWKYKKGKAREPMVGEMPSWLRPSGGAGGGRGGGGAAFWSSPVKNKGNNSWQRTDVLN